MDTEQRRLLGEMAIKAWRHGMDPEACYYVFRGYESAISRERVLLVGGYEIPVFVDPELPEGMWYLLPRSA